MNSHSQRPGIDPLRHFPYYKIQVWDESRAVWIDIQKKFFSVEALRQFVKAKLPAEHSARVMVVLDRRQRMVDPNIQLEP